MNTKTNAPIVIIFPKPGETIEADIPMRGTAQPGAEIYIRYVATAGSVDLAPVDQNGNWSELFSKGTHTVKLSQKVGQEVIDGPGNFTFTVIAAPPKAPEIKHPLPGQNHTGLMAVHVNVGMYTTATAVKAEVGFAGGDVIQSGNLEKSQPAGTWSWTPERLATGYYFVRAFYTLDGIDSRWTADVPFSIGMPT
jgi:hypothetical protein